MTKKQAGFTLIELMISLVLGLIVVAAAGMLLITGQKSYLLQQGSGDIQDNANFGLDFIVRDLRLANLDAMDALLNDRSFIGGIVLTSSAPSAAARVIDSTGTTVIYSNLNDTLVGSTVLPGLLSRSSGMTAGSAPAWTGISNVQESNQNLLSDQLVIQYRPIEIGGYDCEGKEITTTDRIIVQRYFLREDANKNSNEPNKPLALACDAGWYAITGKPTTIQAYGDAGEIIMKRVDYLHFLLGVENANGTHRYMSVNDYLAKTTNFTIAGPRITSVQIGMLVRSNTAVGNESTINNDQEFQVLDKKIKVKSTNSTVKYLRQVVSQSVALRNALGGRGS